MSDEREPVRTLPVRPQIRGEMVFLRPPERSDIPLFVRWLNELEAICDFGFGELRLERIWLDVHVGNARAIRSYEKAGFSIEGTLRHAYYRLGQHVDAHRMALLRDGWEALPRPKSWRRGAT